MTAVIKKLKKDKKAKGTKKNAIRKLKSGNWKKNCSEATQLKNKINYLEKMKLT